MLGKERGHGCGDHLCPEPRFQALLRPLARALAGVGATVNQVTVAVMAGSIAVGAIVAWQAPWRPAFLLLPPWLFLRMPLNALDGMLACELPRCNGA